MGTKEKKGTKEGRECKGKWREKGWQECAAQSGTKPHSLNHNCSWLCGPICFEASLERLMKESDRRRWFRIMDLFMAIFRGYLLR